MKVGVSRHVSGSLQAGSSYRPAARYMPTLGSTYTEPGLDICGAQARHLFLILGTLRHRKIDVRLACFPSHQPRMVALGQAVEKGLGRVALQMTVVAEFSDGDNPFAQTDPKGLFHHLRVVHLTVAYGSGTEAETQLVGAHVVDELLRRDELDAVVFHVASRHRLWTRVLADQLHLGGKRADGGLDAVTLMEPEGCGVEELREASLQLTIHRVMVLHAVVVQLFETQFLFRRQPGVEQRLALFVFLRAGVQFKFDSVCFARHSC